MTHSYTTISTPPIQKPWNNLLIVLLNLPMALNFFKPYHMPLANVSTPYMIININTFLSFKTIPTSNDKHMWTENLLITPFKTLHIHYLECRGRGVSTQ